MHGLAKAQEIGLEALLDPVIHLDHELQGLIHRDSPKAFDIKACS
jgi:hypothetical protein